MRFKDYIGRLNGITVSVKKIFLRFAKLYNTIRHVEIEKD